MSNFDWIKNNLQYFSKSDLQTMVEAYNDSDGLTGISEDQFKQLVPLMKE